MIKAQRVTDENILSLIETMNKTFSFADNLAKLSTRDNIEAIKDIINQILQQTAECAFFIRDYADRRFIRMLATGIVCHRY